MTCFLLLAPQLSLGWGMRRAAQDDSSWVAPGSHEAGHRRCKRSEIIPLPTELSICKATSKAEVFKWKSDFESPVSKQFFFGQF